LENVVFRLFLGNKTSTTLNFSGQTCRGRRTEGFPTDNFFPEDP